MVEKNSRNIIENNLHKNDALSCISTLLDWLWEISLIGDDGNRYWFGGSPIIVKLESSDICMWELVTESIDVKQDPTSVYKVANFNGASRKRDSLPGGSLIITHTEKEVIVELGCIRIICYDDQSWNIIVEDEENRFKADIIHKPDCDGPLWCGQEKSSQRMQKATTHGDNCCGRVEGILTIDGKIINVHGAGIRERYVPIDSSIEDESGWEDWGWFHFDEVFGSLYSKQFGMKNHAITLVNERLYLPFGNMKIEHQDWAYMPKYGGFLPTVYKIQIKTRTGTLNMSARAVNAITWNVTGKYPDNPVATIIWDDVEGTFNYKDGTVQELHNGYGNMSIKQRRTYPSLLPPIGIDPITK